ncbi:hypothetical protein D3C75_1004130 [compost metagenome]
MQCTKIPPSSLYWRMLTGIYTDRKSGAVWRGCCMEKGSVRCFIPPPGQGPLSCCRIQASPSSGIPATRCLFWQTSVSMADLMGIMTSFISRLCTGWERLLPNWAWFHTALFCARNGMPKLRAITRSPSEAALKQPIPAAAGNSGRKATIRTYGSARMAPMKERL